MRFRLIAFIILPFMILACSGCMSHGVSVDECDVEKNDCGDHATCTMVGDNYSCVCDEGYEGDGTTCIKTGPVLRFESTTLTVGRGPWSIITGDFDENGHMDLAVTNSSSNTVSILVGDGAGGFEDATDLAVGHLPLGLNAGDYNEDGHADLAVTKSEYSGHGLGILLGDGSGGFADPIEFLAGTSPNIISQADFDEDSHIDLAVANAFSDNVSILLGDGSGGFADAVNFEVGEGLSSKGPYHMITGDFDENGHVDLAVANLVSDDGGLLLGDGTGGFAPALSIPAGERPRGFAAGDFNEDGHTDLAVANCESYEVRILSGDGDGGFSVDLIIEATDGPMGIINVDFDKDGHQDLALANLAGSLGVLFGDGEGGFAYTTNHVASSIGLMNMAAGDFNEDGLVDVAATVFESETIVILINRGLEGE